MTDIILIICDVYAFSNRVNHSHQIWRSSIGKSYFPGVRPVNDHGNPNYKAQDYITNSILRKDPFWSYANLYNLEQQQQKRDISYMQESYY